MLGFRAMSIILAAFGVTACGGSSGGTEPPPGNPGGSPGPGGGTAGVTVTVRNNNYTPDRATVARGGTVTWRWDSCTSDPYGDQTCASHSVTFDDGSAGAAAQSSGSFAKTFAAAGTFTYYCTSHGRGVMSGAVVVQ